MNEFQRRATVVMLAVCGALLVKQTLEMSEKSRGACQHCGKWHGR